MQPKRILYLIDTGGPGGAESVFSTLVERLDPARWRPVPVVPVQDWLFRRLQSRGFEPLLLPSRRSFDVSYLARIIRVARGERVSLIHAHLLAASVYGSVAGYVVGLPVVCTFHGKADVSPGGRLLSVKLRIMRQLACRIVFVSQSLQEFFISLGLDPGKTEVIHNGIDMQDFAAGADQSFRRELAIGEDEVLIGAIGNIRRPKAYPILLRAAGLLKEQGLPCRFVIVGDTDGEHALYGELVALRETLGLRDSLFFTGFREDIPRILRSLDVCVVSSSSEGFSLTTVQALAAGVPVVATQSGGPEEIIANRQAGLLVPADSPVRLAEGIRVLVLDARTRAQMASRGRQLVREQFGLEAMLARYEAVYEQCLGAGAAACAAEEA
jgi:glycosyltransferase involved in cell wall biosynthesis